MRVRVRFSFVCFFRSLVRKDVDVVDERKTMSLLLSFQPRLGPTLVKKLRVKRPMSRQLDYFSSHAATIPFQPLMLPTTSKPKIYENSCHPSLAFVARRLGMPF